MIVKSDQWKNNKNYLTDIVIIGAGAAGISLSVELSKIGIKSILIEGGDLEYSDISQNLYDGNQYGPYYLQAGLKNSRMRFFGGSTNCWAGGCSTFDEGDFVDREWLGMKKWPIAYSDLKPFYEKAANQLGLDIEIIKNPTVNYRLPQISPFITRSLEYTKKIRFKNEYYFYVRESRFITCMLNANFHNFKKNKTAISSLEIIDNYGNRAEIQAKRYIVCAGGIESTRILMNSAKEYNGGFGSDTGNLGKFFSDHPIAPCATIYFANDNFEKFIAQSYWNKGTEPYFVLPFEFQKKYKITNCALQIFEEYPPLAEHELSALAVYQYANGITSNFPNYNDITNIISNPLLIWKAWKSRKYQEKSRLSVRFQLEQLPSKENELFLLSDKDKLGLNKIGLKWKMDLISRKTIDINLYHLAKFFGNNHEAVLRLDPQLTIDRNTLPIDLRGGQHHCGTTRMGYDSADGVVDCNLKVFGEENLYVLSSSVFPSNSWVNPTFTIVALAHRMASHLKRTI